MKLNILTIVLNGQPWITHHLPVFNRLTTDWHWWIIEGTAANHNCTKWCTPQKAGHSTDGTIQYLDTLAGHPRVTVIRKPLWDGKIEMCNVALPHMTPGVLLEVDADELWTAPQLDEIARLFVADDELMAMRFFCRYFVGQNVVVTRGGRRQTGSWLRAWRNNVGLMFARHEPPIFGDPAGKTMNCEQSAHHGLVFDHMSYVLPEQVAYKERFYGYADATEKWQRLQRNTEWPIRRLKEWLPWAHPADGADQAIKSMIPTSPQTAIPSGAPRAPHNISAEEAYLQRAGPFPRPSTKKFLIVLGFHDGDHEQVGELANLLFDLEPKRRIDTDLMFYYRNDARPMEQAIVERMQLRFGRVYNHRCGRINATGHPYGCNEMWYDLIQVMRGPRWANEYYAFYNMEPDCVPLARDWIDRLSADFRRHSGDGVYAIGEYRQRPRPHMNGAAVYATDFYNAAGGLNLIGGSAVVGYDSYHAARILPFTRETPLIVGHWQQPTITADELFAARKLPDVTPVIYHGVKDLSAIRAVRDRLLTPTQPAGK